MLFDARAFRSPSFFRNLSRRDSALRSSLASVEKAPDEISATGGRRLLSPFGFGQNKLWEILVK
jgi:hypothetical protein